MFDIGFFEIILLAIVGIVVIGPERLPEVTRQVMLWRGRLKRQFGDIKKTIENEVGADDIRQQLHNEKIMKEIDTGKNLVDDLKHEMQRLNNTVNEDTHQNTNMSHNTNLPFDDDITSDDPNNKKIIEAESKTNSAS